MERSLIGILISIVWGVIAFFAAKKARFFKSTSWHEPHLSIIFVLVAFALFISIPVLFSSYFPFAEWKEPITIIAIWVALRIYLQIFPKVKCIIWGPGTFISYRHTFYNLFFGAITWFLCYPIVMFINQMISLFLLLIFRLPHIDQLAVELMKGYLDNPIYFWVMSFIICIVVPPIEEVLFRGFLQTWLKGWMKTRYAIIVTSIIFALFHFMWGQGLQNVSILSALFILSCFLGYIYERQQSLVAPIGLHAVFNAFSIFLIFFQLE